MVPGNNPTAEDGAGSSATTPIADSSAAQVAGFSSWWTASSIGNFLRQDSSSSGGNCPENFHFVGTTTSQPAISPITPSSRQNPSTESPIVHDVNTEEQEICDVDAEEQNICDARTDKRLNWTKDEDIRLASAWLNNSKDPVAGNERKLDLYWSDVTKEYNQNTESYRRRNRNQLKIRWDRVKKPVIEFHGCWIRTTKVLRSGMSDDQLMELAEKMYASEHGDKDFMHKHIWKVVRNERKWSAYVKKWEVEKEMDKGKHGVLMSGEWMGGVLMICCLKDEVLLLCYFCHFCHGLCYGLMSYLES